MRPWGGGIWPHWDTHRGVQLRGGEPHKPPLHPGAGVCRPKAGATSKQSLTLPRAGLMFAAGSSPGRDRRRQGGGFNGLPDPPCYQR